MGVMTPSNYAKAAMLFMTGFILGGILAIWL